ncbi:MAG: hypothetical protein LBQ12_09125, partial [Deltaproteobacteria bacterium]|nr:hypothetical protein [Deltaproteobacteria bacterium]
MIRPLDPNELASGVQASRAPSPPPYFGTADGGPATPRGPAQRRGAPGNGGNGGNGGNLGNGGNGGNGGSANVRLPRLPGPPGGLGGGVAYSDGFAGPGSPSRREAARDAAGTAWAEDSPYTRPDAQGRLVGEYSLAELRARAAAAHVSFQDAGAKGLDGGPGTPAGSEASASSRVQPAAAPGSDVNFFDHIRLKNMNGGADSPFSFHPPSRRPTSRDGIGALDGPPAPRGRAVREDPAARRPRPSPAHKARERVAARPGAAPGLDQEPAFKGPLALALDAGELPPADRASEKAARKAAEKAVAKADKSERKAARSERGESRLVLGVKWLAKLMVSAVFLGWIFVLGVMVGRGTLLNSSSKSGADEASLQADASVPAGEAGADAADGGPTASPGAA